MNAIRTYQDLKHAINDGTFTQMEDADNYLVANIDFFTEPQIAALTIMIFWRRMKNYFVGERVSDG